MGFYLRAAVFHRAGRAEPRSMLIVFTDNREILAARRSVTGCCSRDSTGIDILPPRSPSERLGCAVNFDSSRKLLQIVINRCALAGDGNVGLEKSDTMISGSQEGRGGAGR